MLEIGGNEHSGSLEVLQWLCWFFGEFVVFFWCQHACFAAFGNKDTPGVFVIHTCQKQQKPSGTVFERGASRFSKQAKGKQNNTLRDRPIVHRDFLPKKTFVKEPTQTKRKQHQNPNKNWQGKTGQQKKGKKPWQKKRTIKLTFVLNIFHIYIYIFLTTTFKTHRFCTSLPVFFVRPKLGGAWTSPAFGEVLLGEGWWCRFW